MLRRSEACAGATPNLPSAKGPTYAIGGRSRRRTRSRAVGSSCRVPGLPLLNQENMRELAHSLGSRTLRRCSASSSGASYALVASRRNLRNRPLQTAMPPCASRWRSDFGGALREGLWISPQGTPRTAKARSLLQSVYDRFSEGFDTADLKTAYLNSWQ
jgi:hypothetical protein